MQLAHHQMASTPLVLHPAEAMLLAHQLVGSIKLTMEKQLAWHRRGEMQAAHLMRATSHTVQQAEMAWTPCDGCKGEVERILREKRISANLFMM